MNSIKVTSIVMFIVLLFIALTQPMIVIDFNFSNIILNLLGFSFVDNPTILNLAEGLIELNNVIDDSLLANSDKYSEIATHAFFTGCLLYLLFILCVLGIIVNFVTEKPNIINIFFFLIVITALVFVNIVLNEMYSSFTYTIYFYLLAIISVLGIVVNIVRINKK